jgi:hypothetical protein
MEGLLLVLNHGYLERLLCILQIIWVNIADPIENDKGSIISVTKEIRKYRCQTAVAQIVLLFLALGG